MMSQASSFMSLGCMGLRQILVLPHVVAPFLSLCSVLVLVVVEATDLHVLLYADFSIALLVGLYPLSLNAICIIHTYWYLCYKTVCVYSS